MTYIIGEIGQNHNGDIEIAKQLIDVSAKPVVDDLFHSVLKPMDAVKLTKRDLAEELTSSAMNKPYDSSHAFGRTYGEHRAFLELDDEVHLELFNYAKGKGLEFVETLCAAGCLSMLKLFTPDKLKVASRDLTNLPLLNVMAETKIPMILSTGMAGQKELDAALDVITKHHSDISILHCLSQYPSEYQNLNLNSIHYLKENYADYKIGYSDHSIGIMVPIAAVAMGAEIIEKHITLDRDMKGSDQAGSLGPDGVNRMVRDIRNLELSFGAKGIHIDDSVAGAKTKLERSIATLRNIKHGDIITESDLHLLSPGDGYKWMDRNLVVGKKASVDIPANEVIYENLIS